MSDGGNNIAVASEERYHFLFKLVIYETKRQTESKQKNDALIKRCNIFLFLFSKWV